MSTPLKIVIVGGVAAGPKTAARSRRLNPDAQITIIEKTSFISYAGCGLPYYISGAVEDRKTLMSSPIGVMRNPEFFANVKQIEVRIKTEALAIDRTAQELEIRDLTTGEISRLPYDKLIIATGADPVEPPIPGSNLKNVLRLKQLEDADIFHAVLQKQACPNVVIIGGGLIGLEMTEALVKCRRAVTVVEMLPQLLTMLDPEMAKLIEKRMKELGVKVLTSTKVEKFESDADGNVSAVVTSAGVLTAELVLLSIGIRPNVKLAREAGLGIGTTGGIQVTDRMVTTDPNILAAGDCTEKYCQIRGTSCFLPLGSVANKEGRVAAATAVGIEDHFPGVTGTAALKIFDWNVGRAGMTTREVEKLGYTTLTATVAGPDLPHYYPGAKLAVLKLIVDVKTRRLLGIQGVGAGDVIKRIDVAVTAMTAKMTVDQIANLDLAYAPPYSEAMDLLIHGANIVRNKLDGYLIGVNAEKLHAAMQANEAPFLLDVRTPGEHEAGHIAGCTLIPLGAIRKRASEIPQDCPVVIYCKTSLRAWEAACILKGLGYENVSILDGGISAWPYEIESGM